MALFDRRLLAYFDDGLGSGESSILERIIESQHDLTEIETQLTKNYALLGDRQAQFRPRSREEWIARYGAHKSIKERYRKTAQPPTGTDPHPPEVVGTHAVRRQSAVRGGRRRSSIGSGSAGRGGSRPSLIAAGARTPATSSCWVQIDTVVGLPGPAAPGMYVVRSYWVGQHNQVTETEERQASSQNGEDICIVRQQLKLEGQPRARIVVVSVHRRGDGTADSHVGECHLDVTDPYNQEVQMHPLKDRNGVVVGQSLNRPGGTAVRLRVATPGVTAGAAQPAAQPPAQLPRRSIRPSTIAAAAPHDTSPAVGAAKRASQSSGGSRASLRRPSATAASAPARGRGSRGSGSGPTAPPQVPATAAPAPDPEPPAAPRRISNPQITQDPVALAATVQSQIAAAPAPTPAPTKLMDAPEPPPRPTPAPIVVPAAASTDASGDAAQGGGEAEEGVEEEPQPDPDEEVLVEEEDEEVQADPDEEVEG